MQQQLLDGLLVRGEGGGAGRGPVSCAAISIHQVTTLAKWGRGAVCLGTVRVMFLIMFVPLPSALARTCRQVNGRIGCIHT